VAVRQLLPPPSLHKETRRETRLQVAAELEWDRVAVDPGRELVLARHPAEMVKRE